MIPKSGTRFSEKIMLKEKVKAEQRVRLIIKPNRRVGLAQPQNASGNGGLAALSLPLQSGGMR
jgi:hypothetical protein